MNKVMNDLRELIIKEFLKPEISFEFLIEGIRVFYHIV